MSTHTCLNTRRCVASSFVAAAGGATTAISRTGNLFIYYTDTEDADGQARHCAAAFPGRTNHGKENRFLPLPKCSHESSSECRRTRTIGKELPSDIPGSRRISRIRRDGLWSGRGVSHVLETCLRICFVPNFSQRTVAVVIKESPSYCHADSLKCKKWNICFVQ